ncbi:Protein TSSC1 [Sciurus carolinensis]|uniref:EARP and GARP complex-interacting protein 1 n=1 Tax=Sciurus carolinensis TaxID=30640 RepID=A0AA41SQJ6_SCICA|nr:Protein TSSC1 [Sciurus carolinensis]
MPRGRVPGVGDVEGLWCWAARAASDSRVQARAAVWRMPKELESGSQESPDDSASTAQTLQLLCHLDDAAHGSVACVTWEPMGDGKKVISLADNHILLWDLQESSSQAVAFGDSGKRDGGFMPKAGPEDMAGPGQRHACALPPPRDTVVAAHTVLVPSGVGLARLAFHVVPAGPGESAARPTSRTRKMVPVLVIMQASPRGLLPHPSPQTAPECRSLATQLASSASLEGKGQLKFTSGRWSPHHNCTQVATASDTTLRGWDTRSMSQIYCIENAHGQLVRDLDFNPNKQYYLASCGDDCKVKFWDTRNVTEPVRTLEEHSHWVWSVRYNHSHDQLVLTGSSDSRVILSNMVSISSEPFGHLVDDDEASDPEEHHADEKSKEPLQDNVIATYEEHEDSVYAVDWSSADPWLFASLSYDGRLVINRVPRALKYHILL